MFTRQFFHLLPFEFYSLVEQRCFVAATFLQSSSSCRLEHAPIWHVGVSLCRCISVHFVLCSCDRQCIRRGAGSGNAFDGRRTAYSPTRSSLRPATSRTSSHSHYPARGAKGGLRQRGRQRLRQPWRRRRVRRLRQRRRGRRVRRRSKRWCALPRCFTRWWRWWRHRLRQRRRRRRLRRPRCCVLCCLWVCCVAALPACTPCTTVACANRPEPQPHLMHVWTRLPCRVSSFWREQPHAALPSHRFPVLP